MSEIGSGRPAVGVEIKVSDANVQRAAERDSRLGAGAITEAARLAVAAWVMAADGDHAALDSMTEPDVRDTLLAPQWKPWRVAPGPRVTSISIWALEPSREPVRLRLTFLFTGRFTGHLEVSGSGEGGETDFAATLDLALTGTTSRPWRISACQVRTYSEHISYTFTSRPETPGERGKRLTSGTTPVPPGPGRAFCLTAGFAEHNERLGSSATIVIRRDTAPYRDEAEKLIWPAIWQVTTEALGAGDWWPSINWLDVIELLDG
jgi:hypothetical protein